LEPHRVRTSDGQPIQCHGHQAVELMFILPSKKRQEPRKALGRLAVVSD
jgi:hypothetical protein